MGVLNLKEVREAKQIAKALSNQICGLETIVLDSEWNGCARLVYGGSFVETCVSNCERCLLFKTVKEDPKDLRSSKFVVSLSLARDGQKQNYPGKQKYINCKTLDQYAGCFAACLSSPELCPTEKDIQDELNLIKDFKLIFYRGKKERELLKIEKKLKQRIILLTDIPKSDSRYLFFVKYGRRLGIIKRR